MTPETWFFSFSRSEEKLLLLRVSCEFIINNHNIFANLNLKENSEPEGSYTCAAFLRELVDLYFDLD